MAQTTDCVTTTVKNTSGGSKRFSFLPPHGKEMANNEEYTFPGDLVASVRRPGGFVASQRVVAGLLAAMENGDIEVIATPASVFYDPTLDVSKLLKVDNGVLLLADPCWLATSSSAPV